MPTLFIFQFHFILSSIACFLASSGGKRMFSSVDTRMLSSALDTFQSR